MEDLINLIARPTNYLVDIGSSYGAKCDPLYNFITSNKYRGLCIEGNCQKAEESKNIISKNFTILCDYATPENILNIFKTNNVPTFFDALKIDIDGYDLTLAKQILTSYRPTIINIEYNEKIPPPIKFEVLYKKNYAWDTSHFYGFSIAKGVEEFAKLNYSFYDINDVNNLIFIDNNVIHQMYINKGDIYSSYNKHYKNNDANKKTFYWNVDVEYWQNITDHNQLKKEIIEYYEKRLPNRNYKKLNIDFTCE